MAKRKTEFELAQGTSSQRKSVEATALVVEGEAPHLYVNVYSNNYRSVTLYKNGFDFFLRGDDLETFALNILKALKSKHLKQ